MIIIFLEHLQIGMSLNKRLSYEEYVDDNGSEFLRACKVFSIIFTLLFLIFLLYTLICFCHVSGLDGSRSINSNDLEMFKSIPFGSLVFQQGLDCGICMERITINSRVVQLKCSDLHIFHRHCMNDWIETDKTKCPYCQCRIK